MLFFLNNELVVQCELWWFRFFRHFWVLAATFLVLISGEMILATFCWCWWNELFIISEAIASSEVQSMLSDVFVIKIPTLWLSGKRTHCEGHCLIAHDLDIELCLLFDIDACLFFEWYWYTLLSSLLRDLIWRTEDLLSLSIRSVKSSTSDTVDRYWSGDLTSEVNKELKSNFSLLTVRDRVLSSVFTYSHGIIRLRSSTIDKNQLLSSSVRRVS